MTAFGILRLLSREIKIISYGRSVWYTLLNISISQSKHSKDYCT